MRKQNLVIVTCLILIIILIIRFGAYFINYGIAIKANWGIWLPRGFKEIYSTDSGPSFFGDGERYHVFYYRKGLKEKELEKFNYRSEEHTSELQSRENLVCRLLLEKKNDLYHK